MNPSGQSPRGDEAPCVADLRARGLLDPFSAVSLDAGFETVVRAVCAHSNVRTVAVTDQGGALAGMIPLRTFYGALMADVYPEAVIGNVGSVSSAMRVGGQMGHATAREIMLPAQSVALTDTLHDAFIAVHRSGQDGLPVVDAQRCPVGYLDLLAILPLWEQNAGGAPLAR